MVKPIGLYGGSFDPPHDGHLHVALTALEQGEMEHIWVVPTFRNPLRGRAPIVEGHHRLAMVKEAFNPLIDAGQVTLCDIELKELFACYTIDVIRRLRQETIEPFRLILGSDCLGTLPQWKECVALLELAPPMMIARSGEQREGQTLIRAFNLPAHTKQKLLDGWIEAPCLDISSTRIRERLKEGLYCGHLMPESVLDYIAVHGLYEKSTAT